MTLGSTGSARDVWCPGAWYTGPLVGADGTLRTDIEQPLGPALGHPDPPVAAGQPG